ncbi:MAG: hypothetical protein ACI9J3_003484 [Parvicellaceae bacterium]|jgi:hypothetical protein
MLFLTQLSCWSQVKSTAGFVGGFHFGKLIKIATEFPEVNLNYQLDFGAVWQAQGDQYWHRAYHFPETHLRAIYANYGNNEILGSSISLLAEMHNEISLSDDWFFNWNAGFGFTFFNKPYDAISNPSNLVIGSTIVGTPVIGVGVGRQINEKLSLAIKVNFRHSSNGHYRVPNLGANVPLIGVEVKSKMPKINPMKIYKVLSDSNRYSIVVGAGVGFHEIEGTTFPTDGPVYAVYYGRIEGSKRLSVKSSVHTGLTLNFSEASRRFILNEFLFNGETVGNNLKVVGYIGHEFHFSHLGIYVDLGFNLYDPFRKELIAQQFLISNFMDTHFSNEFGFNYYLKDPVYNPKTNVALHLSLRTIWGKADYLNLGIKTMF